jgi:hypothetical protein
VSQQSNQPNNPSQQTTVVIQRGGMSGCQVFFLLFLTVILVLTCVCGIPMIFALNDVQRQLAAQANHPVTTPGQAAARPANQTAQGVVIVGLKLAQFVPTGVVQPPPGNWWLVTVDLYNGSQKPLSVEGYNIVLKDDKGREFWYNRELSFFAVPNNQLTRQLNPGITANVSLVMELPDDLKALLVYYDGAVLQVKDADIVR